MMTCRWRTMQYGGLVCACLSLCSVSTASDPESQLPRLDRRIPLPLPDRPGNIYLEGESVSVRIGPEIPKSAASWTLYDAEHRQLKTGQLIQQGERLHAISMGALAVGWYRMEFNDANGALAGWTTAAVLKRLMAPTPLDSPVCCDTAMAWFARDDVAEQTRHANLAALAGVNWIRDRITWRDMEPRRGQFAAEPNNYDRVAQIQSEAGLRVLQVFHLSPTWAGDKALDGEHTSARFPRDLRDMFRFCRAMASRFHGKVHAWEPWNEANVEMFGGHTVDEMCSLQKAAYLGSKAGDPTVIVGWNAYTTSPTRQHTQGLIDNHALPYYDTYNIHSYDWHHDYLRLWELARQAAHGKPLWVTEADRGLRYETPGPWYEYSLQNEMHKARHIAQEYVSSMSAGCTRHFHFILGNYAEQFNQTQFGLLREDLTPRPAYVALAAVGRLLAGAKFVTHWKSVDQPDAQVYVFDAWPDGVQRQVIVMWTEKPVDWPDRNQTTALWPLPEELPVTHVYDYLGRPIERPNVIGGSAIFVVCPPHSLSSQTPARPTATPPQTLPASPIVLQIQMSKNHRVKIQPIEWSQGFEYRVSTRVSAPLVFYAYNFANTAASGTVALKDLPTGWTLEPRQWPVRIESMDRHRFEATLKLPPGTAGNTVAGTIQLTGDFGAHGQCVLAFAIQGK